MKDVKGAKLAEEGKCPGSEDIRRPRPEYLRCPSCGEEVEVWTDELEGKCGECGATVSKDGYMSCIEWCEKAEECLGKEKYNQMIRQKKSADE